MKKITLLLTILTSLYASADLRRDKDSKKVIGLVLKHIVKEGKNLPKGATDKAFDQLKDVCSKKINEGCFFWKKGSSFMFQPLNSKGEKNGKIYELDSWLKKVFR